MNLQMIKQSPLVHRKRQGRMPNTSIAGQIRCLSTTWQSYSAFATTIRLKSSSGSSTKSCDTSETSDT